MASLPSPPSDHKTENSSVSLQRRDSEVDADSSLERKRPRLSDDEESYSTGKRNQEEATVANSPSPPLLVGHDDPIVEIVDVELTSPLEQRVVVIMDDKDPSLSPPPSTQFPLFGKEASTLEDASANLAKLAVSKNSLSDAHIYSLADWLGAEADNGSAGGARKAITHDLDYAQFWAHIGACIHGLLGDCCTGGKYKTRESPVRAAITRMLTEFARNCAALLELEVQGVERAAARRDSLNSDDATAHTYAFSETMYYLVMLLLPSWDRAQDKAPASSPAHRLRFDAGSAFVKASDNISGLLTFFDSALTSAEQIRSSSSILCTYVVLVSDLATALSGQGAFPGELWAFFGNVAKLVSKCKSDLLPVILDLQPRELTLPRSASGTVQSLIMAQMLAVLMILAQDHTLVIPLFDHPFHDALNHAQSLGAANIDEANGHTLKSSPPRQKSCVNLEDCVSNIFRIENAMTSLRSKVIIHQVDGIHALNTIFPEIWATAHRFGSPHKDVLIQGLARYVVQKELLKEILNFKTHADVIRRSGDTIRFTLITGNLGNADMDMIWDVASGGGQSDKSEACMAVLYQLARQDLQIHQLSHLLSRISEVKLPLERTYLDLIRAIVERFRSLVSQNGATDLDYDIVESLLKMIWKGGHMDHCDEAQFTQNGLAVAITEALRSTRPPEVRKILTSVTKTISAHSAVTNGSILLLDLVFGFLDKPTVDLVHSILPLNDVCLELIDYVHKERATFDCTMHELSSRIHLVLYRMSRSSSTDCQAMESELWANLVGSKAVSNMCRSSALFIVISWINHHDCLRSLLDRFIVGILPTLPVEHATPALLYLRNHAFNMRSLAVERIESSKTLLEQLVRIALEHPVEETARIFETAVISGLFDGPALQMPEEASEWQIVGASRCIKVATSDGPYAGRAIELLDRIVCKSLQTSKLATGAISKAGNSPITVGNNVSDAVDTISFSINRPSMGPETLVLEVAGDTTMRQVRSALLRETGFADLAVLDDGKRLDFTTCQTVTDAHLSDLGPLEICRMNNFQSILTDPRLCEGRTSVEEEVLTHFDQLYTLLQSDNEVVCLKAFELLRQIRIPIGYRTSVCNGGKTVQQDAFEPQGLWKTAYAALTSSRILEDLTEHDVIDADFNAHSIRTMIDLLMHDRSSRELRVLYTISVTLTAFLRNEIARQVITPNHDASTYFQRPEDYLLRIMEVLISLQLRLNSSTPSEAEYDDLSWTVDRLYTCFLDTVSLSSVALENVFKNHTFQDEHKELLLNRALGVSAVIARLIADRCKTGKLHPSLISWYWEIVLNLLPDTLIDNANAESVFIVAPVLLKESLELSSNEAQLRGLVHQLTTLLSRVQHHEQFLTGSPDHRVQGICQLLKTCAMRLKARGFPLNLGNLALDLYLEFLFPRLKNDDGARGLSPLTNEETRFLVYDLILTICDKLDCFMALVENVIDFGTIMADEYPGRKDFVRNDSGLSGLDNLGQTCYLNSLLQQLFMNVTFRNFILAAQVRSSYKQQVLAELQNTFAYMQASHTSWYCPAGLAKVLDIDVRAQEDAHLFFNELMTKLEDSMPDQDSKKALQEIFGGRNKSQIKGECGHISESQDEYCNLSLTVEGKSGLEDSLQEYVQGASLRGGDKYKCSTCEANGKEAYVNAMRRTALDKIPSSLVLGLKRFRYESFDGGTKVNDKFDFPAVLDMEPYKLKSLADPGVSMEKDEFELAGVIVHQGTLQLGHYWSYAKDHRSYNQSPGVWYRLEDSRALLSDLDTMMQETCGGPMRLANNAIVDRSDSAYILFYRRMDPTAAEDDQMERHQQSEAPLPHRLQEQLDSVNETVINTVHTLDPAHVRFVRCLALQLCQLDLGDRIYDYSPDEQVLNMGFRYLFSVLLPQKDPPELEEYMKAMQRLAMRTPKTARLAVQHLHDPKIFETLVFARLLPVRKTYNDLVLLCLKYLRDQAPKQYGLSENGILDARGVLGTFVKDYGKLLYILPKYRVEWGTYFDLVIRISALGPHETALLLDFGFLHWSLSALYAVNQSGTVLRYNAKLYDTFNSERRFLWTGVVDCIDGLLQHADLSTIMEDAEFDNDECHPVVDNLCMLNDFERHFLIMRSKDNLVLIRYACRQVGYHPRTDNLQYPPGKLFRTLTRHDVAQPYVEFLIGTLMKHLVSDELNFDRLVLAAINVCHSSIDATQKAALVDTMIKISKRFDIIDELLWFMTGIIAVLGVKVFETAQGWATDMLSAIVDDAGSKTLDWLREHVFQAKIVTVPPTPQSLIVDTYRIMLGLIMLEGLTEAFKETLRDRDNIDNVDPRVGAFEGCLAFLSRTHRVLHQGKEDQLLWHEAQALSDNKDEARVTDLGDIRPNPLTKFGGIYELPGKIMEDTKDLPTILADGNKLFKTVQQIANGADVFGGAEETDSEDWASDSGHDTTPRNRGGATITVEDEYVVDEDSDVEEMLPGDQEMPGRD